MPCVYVCASVPVMNKFIEITKAPPRQVISGLATIFTPPLPSTYRTKLALWWTVLSLCW